MPTLTQDQPSTQIEPNAHDAIPDLPGDRSLDDLKHRLVKTYDDKAKHYDVDRAVNRATRYYFANSYRTLESIMDKTHRDSVQVDMPVGTGKFLLHLRQRGYAHRMIGIDIAAGMLGVCADESQKSGADLILSMGDAYKLPLPDNSVDIFTCLRLTHLLPKSTWPAIIAEMRRVLRPGGQLIIEMRNVLRGITCQMLVSAFRSRRDTHPHTFVSPPEASKLFTDWNDVRMQGVGLDGTCTLSRFLPPIGKGLHLLEANSPVRYLSKTLLVQARKPKASC
ncbi:MAG: class I SAM-dependent methyltransferase [Phycisphaerales bacterium]|nr:class I SAM-dependent methyltransferase [Phycisphaerales bacterium]